MAGIMERAAVHVSRMVRLIAWTHFETPSDVSWDTDAEDGQALAEFAGRACYESWHKPNPRTATNAGYLRHILDVGHLSAIEHASATFYVTGVSRSLTHELIRHRHFSFSQLSQRHVPARADIVEPDVIADDPELHKLFVNATQASLAAYDALLDGLNQKFAGAHAGGTLRAKQARQAARSVLLSATETRIVVTGNYRTWRHFIAMRASEHADVEIRELAVDCLVELQRLAPNAFGDFSITTLTDGSRIAASPYVPES